MALSPQELATLIDIDARILAKQPVSTQEKQLIFDLLKREKLAVKPTIVAAAASEGLDVTGIIME